MQIKFNPNVFCYFFKWNPDSNNINLPLTWLSMQKKIIKEDKKIDEELTNKESKVEEAD